MRKLPYVVENDAYASMSNCTNAPFAVEVL